MSTAGGLHEAVLRGAEFHCDAIQLFTKNNVQWAAPRLAAVEIAQFRDVLASTGIGPAVAHTSYLLNLASPNPALYERSVRAFVVEMRRAAALGLPCVITHPGAHMGAGEAAGLKRVARALRRILKACASLNVEILIETTAGPGTVLCHRFQQIAEIMQQVGSDRVGACFDTSHVFAAGYDLRTKRSYDQTMQAFDETVGLDKLRVFHLNDSKADLGSRVDRHEHIGRGKLGLEAFRLLVNDRRFRDHPMLLETPKQMKGKQHWDTVNLKTLRKLMGKKM